MKKLCTLLLMLVSLSSLPVLVYGQEPELGQVTNSSTSSSNLLTQWEIIKNILVKPEQSYISFTLSPFIGYRSYGDDLKNSLNAGFVIIYPLKNNWSLLGGYSYGETFSGHDLKGVHVFDYGVYTTPFIIPKYNLSFYTSAYFSRDSFSKNSHLTIGYGFRWLFKQDIKTVTFADNAIGWGVSSKFGIERNVIIPKNSFDNVHLPRYPKLNVHWKFWKKKPVEAPSKTQ